MIVLTHNILPPYRIPLFNAISTVQEGDFAVVLQAETHPSRRSWIVNWNDVQFEYHMLRSVYLQNARLGVAHHISVGTQKILDELRPQTVVVNGWDNNVSWAAIHWARRNACRVVAWLESAEGTGRTSGRTARAYRKLFLSHVDGVIVPGQSSAAFMASLGFNGAVTHMPNPIGNEALRELALPTGPRSALFVGELSERKGFDLILEAVNELLQRYEGLTIAGSGPLACAARRLAAERPEVTYLGFVEGSALTAAVSAASTVLLPSRRDPWPLVAAEAVAAGRQLVLGPGVGSSADLLHIGAAVEPMMDCSVHELLRASDRVAERAPSSESRQAFTAVSCAEAFVGSASAPLGALVDALRPGEGRRVE